MGYADFWGGDCLLHPAVQCPGWSLGESRAVSVSPPRRQAHQWTTSPPTPTTTPSLLFTCAHSWTHIFFLLLRTANSPSACLLVPFSHLPVHLPFFSGVDGSMRERKLPTHVQFWVWSHWIQYVDIHYHPAEGNHQWCSLKSSL